MKNIVTTLEQILKIHSPSGYTQNIIEFIEKLFSKNKNLYFKKTNKGSLLISFSPEPELILSGHIDTLGAMIKEIKENGNLEITQLGGYPLTSFEGEYVTIRNSKGKLFRGTFLLNNPADHVNKNVRTEKRELEKMSIRLDELVKSKKKWKSLV